MLIFIGACLITSVYVLLSRTTRRYRKELMFIMQTAALLLLSSDRFAYIYRGDVSTLGYVMVRICNFMVFFMTLVLQYIFTLYLNDLFTHDGGLGGEPRRLKLTKGLILAGILLLVISQYTGFYYTFDEYNRYVRSPGFVICYIIPLMVNILQLSLIFQHLKKLPQKISVSILLFTIVPLIASLCQIFMYGLSLTNMSMVGLTMLVYVIDLVETNNKVDRTNRLEKIYLESEQKSIYRLFDQTSKAIVSAIDSKDENTRGHSVRVAGYAKRIAELKGMDEKKCNEIYYAGLLHDVGKIGIPAEIIDKEGDLTDEEYEVVRQHPLVGNRILSSITEFPYLSTGAYYHHEHYDGSGYPSGLKGKEIPEIARIIAVADAYDVMTTGKSYRPAMPIEAVREELLRGTGTQFDPEFASIMLHMIDSGEYSSEYGTQEEKEPEAFKKLHFDDYGTGFPDGIELSANAWEFTLISEQDEDFNSYDCCPVILLFDSLDRKVHRDKRGVEELDYLEYAEVWLDGHTVCTGARNIAVKTVKDGDVSGREAVYNVEAMKYKDHILIRVHMTDLKTAANEREFEVIVSLPDSTRFAFLTIGGEHCTVNNTRLKRSDMMISEGFIPRISPEVSFIDHLSGDVPNTEVDGYRTDASKGFLIFDGMKLLFHTMSLPAARTIWHCPLIVIYYSDDGEVYGKNYREYALICLDGEKRGDNDEDNTLNVSKDKDFSGWKEWIEYNKKGYECEVGFRKKRGRVTVNTENFGVIINNTTVISDGTADIYAAVTGDLCALTDIRIM